MVLLCFHCSNASLTLPPIVPPLTRAAHGRHLPRPEPPPVPSRLCGSTRCVSVCAHQSMGRPGASLCMSKAWAPARLPGACRVGPALQSQAASCPLPVPRPCRAGSSAFQANVRTACPSTRVHLQSPFWDSVAPTGGSTWAGPVWIPPATPASGSCRLLWSGLKAPCGSLGPTAPRGC